MLIVAFVILPRIVAMPAGFGDHQIWLWTYLANYVAPFGAEEPAFPHFWSLCVEEQYVSVGGGGGGGREGGRWRLEW